MKFEILAPAGDKQKLETAFYFGADACYFAGKRWGLRAFSDNFEKDEMAEYINLAHKQGKKCYITVNIQAHNADFEGLADYLKYLEEIKADAIIVSDAGIMSSLLVMLELCHLQNKLCQIFQFICQLRQVQATNMLQNSGQIKVQSELFLHAN